MAANSGIEDTLGVKMTMLAREQTRDPASAAVLGGIPTAMVDGPITVIFLILFALGAVTHISIYRANAKRGHKFLLSDLMFDFCMVRIVTCIFRIIWMFIDPRGVVLAASIFENGGAAVIFAVNMFFAQRLIRAMHPSVGWHPVFSVFSLCLIFSVPATIVMNIVALSVSFFSVGKPEQLEATEHVLKFGVSWSMMLVLMPLLWLFIASASPGPPPENFGTGDLRAKAALLVFSAATLAVGAAVRLAAAVNPERPGEKSLLFSKGVFYGTGFLLEILTVALYAFFRIDLIFHVPNGARQKGDYAGPIGVKGIESRLWTLGDIEREVSKIGVRYQILRSNGGWSADKPLLAMLYPDSTTNPSSVSEKTLPESPQEFETGSLPPRRATRVSRRQSLFQALRPDRPPRADRATLFMTDDLPSMRWGTDTSIQVNQTSKSIDFD